ncbi:MAG: metallophosphoesterase [Desulfurellales bacterium]|nr:MAG: metallophosphoesterase [Desulfurellales bacterium]
MRIVCISDTHNSLKRIAVPDGDVLVHAGDLTMSGTVREVATQLQHLAALPHRYKVFIAGNHDWLFQRDSGLARGLVDGAGLGGNPLIYLEESAVTIDGIAIWGSPWQPEFCNWAFNYDRAEGVERWASMPHGLDILVTHGPPHGYGDIVPRGERVGCFDLADAVAHKKPRYHIFGHIHCGYGVYEGVGACAGTTFINASCLGEDYKVTNKPVVIDL